MIARTARGGNGSPTAQEWLRTVFVERATIWSAPSSTSLRAPSPVVMP